MTGSDYRRAAVVGGGVIGTSWTALFLARGLGVTVSDPLPDVQQRVRTGLREIAPTLARLGLPVYDLTDDTGALTFEPDLARAVAAADVIQENGPERPDVKQELWATIEGAAPSRALFASSSSGIPASPMRQKMREPGRLIVGARRRRDELDRPALGAVAGPFQTFHLGGGPGGLADFLVHLGPALAALWSQLGDPAMDTETVDLPTEQAKYFDGNVAQLAQRRDDAQIELMRALGETPTVASRKPRGFHAAPTPPLPRPTG